MIVSQTTFAGGIMSPMMMGRTDDPKFRAGMKECENFIVLPQGSIQNRVGFAYVSEIKDSNRKARLIPFQFAADQTAILEMGHKYIRFYIDGKILLDANGTNPYEIATPYEEEDVSALRFAQSADVMTFVHGNYAPRELRRYSLHDWRLVEVDFRPKLTPPTNVRTEVTHSAEEDKNKSKYTFKYCVTALNDDRTIQSEKSADVSATANIYNSSGGVTVKILWDKVNGAGAYRVYRYVAGVPSYLGETEDTYMIDENISPDSDYVPPMYDDPFQTNNGIASVTVTNGGSGYGTICEVKSVRLSGGRYHVTRYEPIYEYDPDGPDQVVGYTSIDCGWVENYTPKWAGRYCDSPTVWGNGKGGTLITKGETPAGYKAGVTKFLSYNKDRRLTDAEAAEIGATETERVFGGPSLWAKTLTGITITDKGKNLGRNTWARFAEGRRDPYLSSVTAEFPCEMKPVAPRVYVTDPTGAGAILRARINGAGQVVGIDVLNPGSGYTNPKIVIDSTPSGGSGATATASVGGKTPSYPSCVTYFEQRKVFASTSEQPQAIWMTKTGTEDDLSYCVPSRDDDRISFKIASRERNKINHLVPMNRLFVLTEAAEWVVGSVNSDAITPSSISLKGQSFVGSNNVVPLIVNNNMLYVAGSGGHVRELGYSYNSGGYVTGDLSLRATHLFDRKEIVESAFTKAPHPIAWFVNSDGDLIAFTYVPDEGVGAWHKHTTLGKFESVAVVPEGEDDSVYCIVKRNVNGREVRFVERMGRRYFEKIEDAFFVDCGGTYKGTPKSEITGINWLEGCTVNILADGAELPPQVVKDGKIELPVEASTVQVGLPITAKMTTLSPYLQAQDGDYSYAKKNVERVYLRVLQSSGIFVSPEDGEMVEYKQRTDEPLGSPPQPVTGCISIPLKAMWSDKGTVSVIQTSPLPLTILSIASDIRVGG